MLENSHQARVSKLTQNFRQKKNNLISIVIPIKCNLASKYQTECVNNTLVKILSNSVSGLMS